MVGNDPSMKQKTNKRNKFTTACRIMPLHEFETRKKEGLHPLAASRQDDVEEGRNGREVTWEGGKKKSRKERKVKHQRPEIARIYISVSYTHLTLPTICSV